jgi:homoserine kinase type II
VAVRTPERGHPAEKPWRSRPECEQDPRVTAPESVSELLPLWGIPDDAELTAPRHGSNNQTFITAGGDRRWVLRISENLSADQVRAEHRLLGQLLRTPLPFHIPEPVATLAGDTVVDFPAGPASVCRWIAGVRPDLASERALERLGIAIGVLSEAMQPLPLDDAPQDWRGGPLSVLRPEPDIEQLSRELHAAGVSHARVALLGAAARQASACWQRAADGLPIQIVHGDLGASNALVDEHTGEVTGLLDFEIAGADFRVQDLVAALLLSGALAAPDWPVRAAALIRGFTSVVRLDQAEIRAVPDLILCRSVGSVLWRANRWRRVQATVADVTGRLQELAATTGWHETSGEQFLSLMAPA